MIGSRLLTGAGYTLKVPAIDLAEVGAGGGSHVWIDAGGALQIGPESAGASPGPVCYDQGGTVPTVTDANVLLGYINPQHLVGGALKLNAAQGARGIRREHRGAAEDDGRGCGLWRVSDRGVEHDPCDPRGIERARARSARVRAVRIRRQRAAVRRRYGGATRHQADRRSALRRTVLVLRAALRGCRVSFFAHVPSNPAPGRSGGDRRSLGCARATGDRPTRDRRIHRCGRTDQALSRAALQGTDLRTGRTGDRRPDRRRDDVLS